MLSLQKGCLVMRTTMATSTNALRPPPPPHPNIELTVLPRQDTPRYLAPRLPSNAYRRSSSIHIYIYIFFRCVARVVKTLHETRFQGLTFSVKRNWDPEEIELVPGRLFPGLKRARGKQSTRYSHRNVLKQLSIDRMISLLFHVDVLFFPPPFPFFFSPPSIPFDPSCLRSPFFINDICRFISLIMEYYLRSNNC